MRYNHSFYITVDKSNGSRKYRTRFVWWSPMKYDAYYYKHLENQWFKYSELQYQLEPVKHDPFSEKEVFELMMKE